ncbi:pentapeptide repeat-containing protein [Nonomuraea sp. NPDC050328]|uniref:pentapeptide repeat-containing protein n=1 Tax=Nonomuraea sp. NPDC050328 TaxID=3364361 RepID=UPI0037B42F95
MDWVTCSHAAACTGIARPPYGLCLFHLPPDRLDAELAALAPARLLDLRGTRLDPDLLARVLAAVRHRPGRTRLDHARFPGEARLAEVEFAGDVSLNGARFDRLASFYGSRFLGNVSLVGAGFGRELSFHGARVLGHLCLDAAGVARDALFSEAVFARGLSAERAHFDGHTSFDGAVLGETASLRGARFGHTLSLRKLRGGACFERARLLGPVYASVTGRLSFAHAQAGAGVDLAVRGGGVDLRHAVVDGPVRVRLTDSRADLEGAVLRGRAALSGRGLAGLDSLRRVVAPELSLTGLDLSTCRFAGLAHPGGLRVRECSFPLTPRGVRLSLGWPPLRWFTRRRHLADEYGWRGWSKPVEVVVTTEGQASLRASIDDRDTASGVALDGTQPPRKAGRRWWRSPAP